MFHLLTTLPINAAEQKEYCISNVLKKPQHLNICQFVHCVEQLNAYIAQVPCFYYSPHANASTKLKNIPFTEAELGGSCAAYVSTSVAEPVQHEQEGHDADGHALASDII